MSALSSSLCCLFICFSRAILSFWLIAINRFGWIIFDITGQARFVGQHLLRSFPSSTQKEGVTTVTFVFLVVYGVCVYLPFKNDENKTRFHPLPLISAHILLLDVVCSARQLLFKVTVVRVVGFWLFFPDLIHWFISRVCHLLVCHSSSPHLPLISEFGCKKLRQWSVHDFVPVFICSSEILIESIILHTHTVYHTHTHTNAYTSVDYL